MKVYVSKDGQQYGPYTIEQLREYVQQGNFTTGDHACFDGQNWVTIAQVPGFAAGGDLVTTPQYPQAVQQQPASADASTSLPKKKKIIFWSSIGGIATLLAAGLLTWLLSGEEGVPESNQSPAEPDAKESGGNRSLIAGGWTTVDGIPDGGNEFNINLKLTHDSDVVGGTAEIVVEERGDLPDRPFQLTEVRFDGERLSFVIPIFPENRDDCVILHLKLDKEHLKGTFREVDETARWDSHEIVFRRGGDDGESGEDSPESSQSPADLPGAKNSQVEEFDAAPDAPKVVVDGDEIEERDDLYYFEGKLFTGLAVDKYDNGQKKWEGNLKDGKQDGLSTFWHEDGWKEQEANFEDGKQDGLYTVWDEDGQKEAEGTYKDGKLDGLATEWGGGRKNKEHTYKDGKRVGIKYFHMEWYKEVENIAAFKEQLDKDVQAGNIGQDVADKVLNAMTPWSLTSSSAYWVQRKEEGTYKDGKKDGLWTEWYENGQKEEEGTYKDGKEDGLWTEWYENGQKKEERTYKNGERYGLWMSWDENGQKKEEATYKDGEVDGLETMWHENGQKRSEAKWKDGKIVSAFAWKPNGEKCPVTNVVDGNGITVWYNPDGTEKGRMTHKDGELVED